MYVKVENGNVTKYPYSFGDLRRDNPQTCFPTNPSEDCLIDFNTYIVSSTVTPEFDRLTQKVIPGVELVVGMWTQKWTIQNLPQEIAEKNVRNERDRLLSQSDWRALNDQTLSPEWETYRQALREVPQQAGFPFSVNWPTLPS